MQAGDPYSSDKTETLTDLERESAELEDKLKEVRASVVALRAKELAREIDSGMLNIIAPETQADNTAEASPRPRNSKQPTVMLAELHRLHPLRRKWQMPVDLPATENDSNDGYDIATRNDFAREGCLRLFGLLSNGEPWECSIVYSNLMNDGGITIGRDAAHADVVLSDASVSRCHARLELTNRGLVVTDENSTNGTGINDMMLTNYDKQAMLNDGDMLNIAEINLFIELI